MFQYHDLPEGVLFWLVASRFAVIIVAAVAFIWALGDIMYWLRNRNAATKLNLSYHLAVICAALAIELASPLNYVVAGRLFDIDINQRLQGVLMLMSMLFVFGFFILAQVTRLIYRGVKGKLLWVAAGLHTSGIILLIGVGAYFNVYLR